MTALKGAIPKPGDSQPMGFSYAVYGLRIQANLPIAGLNALPAHGQIDIQVVLGSMPPFLAGFPDDVWREYYVSPEPDENGDPDVRIWQLSGRGYFRIDYLDGTVVLVDEDGSRIWATWPDTATLEDTATYLLGPVLGFALRLRGTTSLHASAVVIEDMVVAFVGSSGSGKSTTAAAFARLGYSVLTDDVLALIDHGNEFMVQPAYPRVRLWPRSVEGLFGSEDALPKLTPTWDKRFLDLDSAFRFQHEPLPLAAIYFLDGNDTDPPQPRIEGVGLQEGLMSLIAHTSANYLLDKPMRAAEFEVLGRLAESIPMRQVYAGVEFADLPVLCEIIAADCRTLSVSTVPIRKSVRSKLVQHT